MGNVCTNISFAIGFEWRTARRATQDGGRRREGQKANAGTAKTSVHTFEIAFSFLLK